MGVRAPLGYVGRAGRARLSWGFSLAKRKAGSWPWRRGGWAPPLMFPQPAAPLPTVCQPPVGPDSGAASSPASWAPHGAQGHLASALWQHPPPVIPWSLASSTPLADFPGAGPWPPSPWGPGLAALHLGHGRGS